ncbi:SMI1/KNR4 family protein [Actinomadura sp. 21ATH]|uniref:SMI1/KNR4 family protein n=1 Tax=Actinomadura sp. 21ATH TaxID=1735444 RepID=UPI0035C1BED2
MTRPETVTFRATTENGEVVDNPAGDAIRALMDGLDTTDNTFVIIEPIEDDPSWYMVISLRHGDTFEVERRDLARQEHELADQAGRASVAEAAATWIAQRRTPRQHWERAAVESLDEAGRRIEAWLRTNAPVTFTSLGSPAAAEEVAAVARRLESEFPPDLTAWLLRHGGARGGQGLPLPRGFVLLGAQEMAAYTERRRKLDADAGDPEQDWYWPRECVGLAANAMSADALLVDCTPGAGFGRLGTHDAVFGIEFDVASDLCAPSIGALLTEVADCLEQGGHFREGFPSWDDHPERPAVLDGRLIWRTDEP